MRNLIFRLEFSKIHEIKKKSFGWITFYYILSLYVSERHIQYGKILFDVLVGHMRTFHLIFE